MFCQGSKNFINLDAVFSYMIISFYNHKGGVGKTTDVQILAYAFLNKGKRVLLVDLDPQQYLSLAVLPFNKFDEEITSSYDIAVGKAPSPVSVEVFLLDDTTTTLDIIPTLEKDILLFLKQQIPQAYPTAIKDGLEGIKNKYDYIIIDLPPQVTMPTWWGLVASDFVIVPITLSDYSQYGSYTYVGYILPYITKITKVKTLGFLLSNVSVRDPEFVYQMVSRDLEDYTRKVFSQYPELLSYIYKEPLFKTYVQQTKELRDQIRGRANEVPVFHIIRKSTYLPTKKLRDMLPKIAEEVEGRINNFVSL